MDLPFGAGEACVLLLSDVILVRCLNSDLRNILHPGVHVGHVMILLFHLGYSGVFD